ncbi:MAG TPA: PPOX class F420-dependent oxidoreductase [Dehalococcoidia bacterium]|nr:PPOX class F420-dependent oxidoreductase [Dehalococcoidia bacterium]
MPKRLKRDEWERFLRGRRVGVLATISADGTPVLTPIWYLYRRGLLLVRTGKESVKARNIQRDPRVTVCVQDERPPYASVTVYGRAAIGPDRGGLIVEIARHYLGGIAGAAYVRGVAEGVQQSAEITIAVTPERVLTQDFSADTPAFGRAWLLLKRVLPPWL